MFELRPYRKNNSVSYYNPFRDMESFEKAFFGDPYYRNALAEFKTDITDEGDHFLLEADMPGFEKNDIHLDVSGDTLTIKAERLTKNKTEDKKDRYVCSERSYGSYSRSFDITGIDFALTALFVVLFIEQVIKRENRAPGAIGLVCSVVGLAVFGADNMVIPAMVLTLIVLLAGRRKLCA